MKLKHNNSLHRWIFWLFLWGCGAGVGTLVQAAPDAAKTARSKEEAAAVFAQLPLRFEANRGQTDPQVRFLARGDGYQLFLTPRETVLEMPQTTLRLSFSGANSNPAMYGLDEQAGAVNYFQGPSAYHAETFGQVRCRNVYAGVDVVYYGQQRQLEYDFIVQPHADPSRIKLQFTGADKLTLDAHGDLLLHTAAGLVRQKAPHIYQQIEGAQHTVTGRYVLSEGHQVGFSLGAYNRAFPLIIDPVLTYATYLGGSEIDLARAIAVDAAGNTYLTGTTRSLNFPATTPPNTLQLANNGNYDVFVVKLNAAGNALIYSTYLGGMDFDAGHAIAVDAAGNAYLTGIAGPGFPTANALQAANAGGSDAFITKLNPAGNALVYSTYLGTATSADEGNGIAVDAAGNVLVTGVAGAGLPTVNAYRTTHAGGADAFLGKLNAAGNAFAFLTYLGGSGNDYGQALAMDTAGRSYVTGLTYSTNFPTLNPRQSTLGGAAPVAGEPDAFAAKFDAQGVPVYATYLGGGNLEEGLGVAADAAGNTYLTGRTASTDFPTANPLQAALNGSSNAYVVKLSPNGTQFVYATYLGAGATVPFALALDANRNVFVTGATNAPNFPLANTLQTAYGGGSYDAFVLKLNAAGNKLLYSSYLGGSNGDAGYGDVGYGLAVDANGAAYVAGYTPSTDFPVRNALRTANGGRFDAFVAKITTARYTLSGRVSDPSGNPLSGVTLTLGSTTVTTNSTGNYSFPALDEFGDYTLTPNKAGLAFTPATQTANNLSSNQTLDFVGQAIPVIAALELGTQNSSTDQTLVGGCNPDAGLVRLSAPAPAGGVTVNLTSSLSAASVPATVTVPAGRTTATFYTTTAQVATSQTGPVTASANGVTLTQTLTVRPLKVRTLTLSAASVSGTQQVTATATLECAATNNTVLTLASSVPGVATVNAATATVAAGASLTTFTVTTIPQNKARASIINATTGGVTTGAKLTVNP